MKYIEAYLANYTLPPLEIEADIRESARFFQLNEEKKGLRRSEGL